MGEGAARAATVAGAGTVHRVEPQEAGPAHGVLSVRHSAGQGRCSARQGRLQGGSYSAAGGWWRRFEDRLGCRRRAGHPRPRLRKGRARTTVQQGQARQHACHWPHQDPAGSADAVLVSILTTRNEKRDDEDVVYFVNTLQEDEINISTFLWDIYLTFSINSSATEIQTGIIYITVRCLDVK